MNLDTITQIWITVFGAAAMWLINGSSVKWTRWGPIMGMLGQPAWYVQLVLHDQWLMMPVYALYTACWVKGLWTHWLCKDAAAESQEGILRSDLKASQEMAATYNNGLIEANKTIGELKASLLKSIENTNRAMEQALNR